MKWAVRAVRVIVGQVGVRAARVIVGRVRLVRQVGGMRRLRGLSMWGRLFSFTF